MLHRHSIWSPARARVRRTHPHPHSEWRRWRGIRCPTVGTVRVRDRALWFSLWVWFGRCAAADTALPRQRGGVRAQDRATQSGTRRGEGQSPTNANGPNTQARRGTDPILSTGRAGEGWEWKACGHRAWATAGRASRGGRKPALRGRRRRKPPFQPPWPPSLEAPWDQGGAGARPIANDAIAKDRSLRGWSAG